MALRDDYTAILRQELGPGFEAATQPQLERAFVKRALRSRLAAIYRGRVDDTALVVARQAAEQALRDETANRIAALATADSQLENDLGGL